MNISRVARRYAEAILLALPEGLSREDFFNDIFDLKSSLAQSRELQSFFKSPIIGCEKKNETIKALFGGSLHAFTVEVLEFLTEKTRERGIMDILEALIELKRDQDGILFAIVSSATPLDDGHRIALEAALRNVSQRSVEAEYKVDPSLLGGVVARMNNIVYDGSVVHQLNELRIRFLSGS
jgi:F-type H+-transporting ATPase subunit delta